MGRHLASPLTLMHLEAFLLVHAPEARTAHTKAIPLSQPQQTSIAPAVVIRRVLAQLLTQRSIISPHRSIAIRAQGLFDHTAGPTLADAVRILKMKHDAATRTGLHQIFEFTSLSIWMSRA